MDSVLKCGRGPAEISGDEASGQESINTRQIALGEMICRVFLCAGSRAVRINAGRPISPLQPLREHGAVYSAVSSGAHAATLYYSMF
jgi:hypothetical protein